MKKIFLIFIFLCVSHLSAADIIVLHTGEVLKRKIIRRTPVFIRIEPTLGDPNREILMDNIKEILPDSAEANLDSVLVNITEHPTLNNVPSNVQKAARDMASALIAEAIKEVSAQVPQNVRAVAEEKATEIVAEVVRTRGPISLDNVSESIRRDAERMATALVEETVRSALMPSLNDAPAQVKIAAQERARALIEEAVEKADLNSKDGSPAVRMAVAEKAAALLDQAIENIEIENSNSYQKTMPGEELPDLDTLQNLVEMLPEGVMENISEVSSPDMDEGSEDSLVSHSDSLDSNLGNTRVHSIVLKENDRMIIEEIIEEELEPVIEEIEVDNIPLEENTEVIEEVEDVAYSDDSYEGVVTGKYVEKVAPLANRASGAFSIPKKKSKSMKRVIQDQVMALSYKDYFIIVLIIILLIALLKIYGNRNKGLLRKTHYNIDVMATLIYQEMGDDLRARFSSEDIKKFLLLHVEFKTFNPSNQDLQKCSQYIHENTLKQKLKMTEADIKAILDVEEKCEAKL